MSQLAREHNYNLIVFRYQTIYENIILIMYYIYLTEKIVVIFCFYLLINVVTLNNRHMDLSVENSKVINSEYLNKILYLKYYSLLYSCYRCYVYYTLFS